jgi:16S rRNA (cytosine1402-N4)-methyltransferase
LTDGETDYHTPVMVAEVLQHLEVERGGLYFDGTVGGGGHAEAILQRSPEARVIGVDLDREAQEATRHRLRPWAARLELVVSDYASAAERLTESLSGALLDLGVSSHQIDETRRGFSFRRGAPLDMRMSATGPTAADLLNELSEGDLADVVYRYGEERRSRRLAGEVVRRRAQHRFETADDLVAAMHRAFGANVSARAKARIFQALRIAVNAELEQLERALPALRDRLRGDAVLVVISYHSLEDRIVKENFREWSRDCVCPPDFPVCVCDRERLGSEVTRKPVTPSAAEMETNPRARSAKLRAWRKAA